MSAAPAGAVAAALAAATRRLAAVSDTPRLDAELLMADALGVTRDAVILTRMDDAAPDGFAPLVERRLAHEPVAYILGRRAFWTIELKVGPGVLIPRPDSETLIEAAVAHFGARGPARILDLGTGPGTLLLAALSEWPDAKGIGIDASPVALDYARENAGALGLEARAAFLDGDWAEGVAGAFDLILCNPPYVGSEEPVGESVRRFEPAEALFAGADGLDDYRRVIPTLRPLLAPGGAAILEIGWTQGEAVAALAEAEGFAVAVKADLGARPRAVILT